MNLEQDQPYIDRALKGDMNAFAFLIDRYKHMVFTLAMRMVKNREEAEEISQDTFLKVYNALDSFKGGAKFSTWVYKIAYYRSLDYIKKLGRTPKLSPIEGLVENSIVEEKGILDKLEQIEKKGIIKEALQFLPGDDGILITLHYFEELSLQEISEIMEINVNNVKVKLFRARKRLHQILINKLEPEIISSYARR
ncbi:MAG: sigma-70 family RNA polymerase sigma factor [Maribacter sp.]|nr:sigma-70 family RNA polymerase sigma factor [Maribacter sp.]